jgi:hypothetical protein
VVGSLLESTGTSSAQKLRGVLQLMEPRIVFLPSPVPATSPRVARRAGMGSCARCSPLLAAAPPASPASPEPRRLQLVAAAAGKLRRIEPPCPQPVAAVVMDIRRGAAIRFFAGQLIASGTRPATGAAPSYSYLYSDSFRSTDRCALPGTEGATRAHVDTLTTLVSTSPRRFQMERAPLCPRAHSDTLSPEFFLNSWLATILSSSTSISQKPASH